MRLVPYKSVIWHLLTMQGWRTDFVHPDGMAAMIRPRHGRHIH